MALFGEEEYGGIREVEFKLDCQSRAYHVYGNMAYSVLSISFFGVVGWLVCLGLCCIYEISGLRKGK